MSFIVGRDDKDCEQDTAVDRPTASLGRYLARDGSSGVRIGLDIDRPHAISVVGKRGYGKSYTLGVIAEALSRPASIAPVVVDPMGVFSTLATGESTGSGGGTEQRNGTTHRSTPRGAMGSDQSVSATVHANPTISPDTLDPRSWCALVGLAPESGPGSLLWQAAQQGTTIAEMATVLEETTAPNTDRRAARNHLMLAESWGIFDPDGLDAGTLSSTDISVLDLSGLGNAPMNAIVRAVGEALYTARVRDSIDRLPWLLVDEAHTFLEGIAAEALDRLLTRGRAPGVSLVLATQRPRAVTETGLSQSDILIAHRLTAHADIAALREAQPTYLTGCLDDQLPSEPGEVLIVDDATETVHTARVRERYTPHDGSSPRASQVTQRN